MLMTGDMLTDDVSFLNSSHFPPALYTDCCNMYGAVIVIMEELCNAEQAALYLLTSCEAFIIPYQKYFKIIEL